MNQPIQVSKKASFAIIGTLAAVLFLVLLESGPAQTATNNAPAPTTNTVAAEATVTLAPSQLNAIKIEAVGTRSFSVEKTAIGNIDYNEDLSVQVFSPYQGKIITAFANLGDEVKKEQPLYTIDSPDLVQAEST